MIDHSQDKELIESMWEIRSQLSPDSLSQQQHDVIFRVLDYLSQGQLRVSVFSNGKWELQEWLKKAILLSFRALSNTVIEHGIFKYVDKVPLRFSEMDESQMTALSCRVVPGAVVRQGVYIGKDTVITPSFINMGSYIDEGTMIDSGTTVGSCAQIGKRCHISAGVVIGGVLEPIQGYPVIIEDDVMVGALSVIAEGVIVHRGSVLGTGVRITQSTKIFNRQTQEVTYGVIPPYSVVVPGSLPDPSGCSIDCAVIVKTITTDTAYDTVNNLLR